MEEWDIENLKSLEIKPVEMLKNDQNKSFSNLITQWSNVFATKISDLETP